MENELTDIKPLEETVSELLASENEYNKQAYYENKPEVPPEDLALQYGRIKTQNQLKEELLKPTKIKIKIKKTKKKPFKFCK